MHDAGVKMLVVDADKTQNQKNNKAWARRHGLPRSCPGVKDSDLLVDGVEKDYHQPYERLGGCCQPPGVPSTLFTLNRCTMGIKQSVSIKFAAMCYA